MDDDAQIAFSALFGPLQRSITVHREDTERRLRRDELSDISNVAEDGTRLAADDRKRLLQRPARLWHTDSSFRNPPGRYTFLAARILPPKGGNRSEEHTSELQSLMRNSYAAFCLKKNKRPSTTST